MTREKAIKVLLDIDKAPRRYFSIEEYAALDMAIKVLGQEPILDKIRTEIEQIYEEIDTCPQFSYSFNEYENAIEQGKERAYENVMQIIDKYKAKSE